MKVKPFDVAGLSREMFHLLRDDPRRAALGRAAKAYSRHFDWDDLAQRYEDFFETVLTERVKEFAFGADASAVNRPVTASE